MKKLVIISAIALAACNSAEDAATDEAATEEAVVEEVASTAADGGPSAGTYEVTDADGTVNTYVANEDGTFVFSNADGEQIATGTWRQDGPNRWCDTAEGEEEECYIESVDENGVYNSVNENDPEETSTIVRIS